MTKVILDIPADKIRPFLEMVVKLNIKHNRIASKLNASLVKPKPVLFLSKYLLFDWEFYSNELEFE